MKEERENTKRRIRCVTSSIGKSKNNKNVVSIFAEYQWKKPLWNFPLDGLKLSKGCGLIHSLPRTRARAHTQQEAILYTLFFCLFTKIVISVFFIKDCESNKYFDAKKDISFLIFIGQFYTLRPESMFW